MPLNVGYIQVGGTDVYARVFYDESVPASPDQPLVNAPVGKDYGGGVIGRGWCLELVNRTGERAQLTVNGIGSAPLTLTLAQGDPVTTGPATGRSRTAAQMAALGFTTRDSVGSITME